MSEPITDLIKAVWSSEASKEEFANDPKAFFLRYGIKMPIDAELVPHFDQKEQINIVIPESSAELESAAIQSKDPLLKLLDKASRNEALKKDLLLNNSSSLANNGIRLIEGVDYKVYANTASTIHVVIPTNPATSIEDLELEQATGGMSGKDCSIASGTNAIGCTMGALSVGLISFGATVAIMGGTSAVIAGSMEAASNANS